MILNVRFKDVYILINIKRFCFDGQGKYLFLDKNTFGWWNFREFKIVIRTIYSLANHAPSGSQKILGWRAGLHYSIYSELDRVTD